MLWKFQSNSLYYTWVVNVVSKAPFLPWPSRCPLTKDAALDPNHRGSWLGTSDLDSWTFSEEKRRRLKLALVESFSSAGGIFFFLFFFSLCPLQFALLFLCGAKITRIPYLCFMDMGGLVPTSHICFRSAQNQTMYLPEQMFKYANNFSWHVAFFPKQDLVFRHAFWPYT